ncbi:hypothetical protein R3P38DRAFT_3216946 [Favolaschia claudopus]|uniref:Uncharacterized protein n=1 Tax=Favolaschia claudopus TaxID=2862362 RepID=A0AAW0A5Q7_9AGAR
MDLAQVGFRRIPEFGPKPKLSRYIIRGRIYASPHQGCCVFQLQHRKYADLASDAETLPLRDKLFKYFAFNAKTMAVSSQAKPCLFEPSATLPFRLRYTEPMPTETMRVRTKLAVYFDFNTETMQFSSQVVSTSFWVARARAYTLEVIHTHLYQIFASIVKLREVEDIERTVHNSSLQTHNSTQFAPSGFRLQFTTDIETKTQFIQIDYVRAFNEYATAFCFDFGIFPPPSRPLPPRTRNRAHPLLPPNRHFPLYSRCGPSRARIAPLIWRQVSVFFQFGVKNEKELALICLLARFESWRAETPLSALLALTVPKKAATAKASRRIRRRSTV